MRAAATAAPTRRMPVGAPEEAGFSLTEVLVTLSIIAFTSAMILGTSRPADPLKQEGERLAQTLAQLESRARISGEPMGLVLEPGAYTAAAWTGNEWIPVPRSARKLPAGIVVQLPAPVPRDISPEAEDTLRPQIMFDPLGHSGPAEVELRAGTRTLTVPPRAGDRP
jgi:prepilin-type N-terminal cleavage/methylation domain-containing protein